MSEPPPVYVARLGNAVFAQRMALRTSDASRYAAPLSLRDAARLIGVSAATLSRVERGLSPDLETFRKLCLWLDKSADELLGLRP